MSKALIIKGVDFTTNALATVSIGDVQCTGITLNKSTTSIENIGTTETLIATPAPSNTTDSITWSSSDTSIATVANGVVTAMAEGTATITVTCGTQSASCTVSVVIGMAFYKGGRVQFDIGNDYVGVSTSPTSLAIAFGCNAGNKHICTYGDYDNIYPYPIPSGAKTITVSQTDYASLIVWLDSDATTSNTSEFYNGCAKAIYGETAAGGKENSIGAWTYDTRTYTIPNNSAIDSFVLYLSAEDSTVYGNFDPTNPGITITFGFE